MNEMEDRLRFLFVIGRLDETIRIYYWIEKRIMPQRHAERMRRMIEKKQQEGGQ